MLGFHSERSGQEVGASAQSCTRKTRRRSQTRWSIHRRSYYVHRWSHHDNNCKPYNHWRQNDNHLSHHDNSWRSISDHHKNNNGVTRRWSGRPHAGRQP